MAVISITLLEITVRSCPPNTSLGKKASLVIVNPAHMPSISKNTHSSSFHFNRNSSRMTKPSLPYGHTFFELMSFWLYLSLFYQPLSIEYFNFRPHNWYFSVANKNNLSALFSKSETIKNWIDLCVRTYASNIMKVYTTYVP